MIWQDQQIIRRALQLYFIMGSNNCRKDPIEVLTTAIEGGITLFQFREKGTGALHGEARIDLARKMRQLCREHGVPFIVNDDVGLALKVEADGVHVGQEDEAAATVRSKIGNMLLLGVSAHNCSEARTAMQNGADYLGVGPLFATRTKEDAKAPSGVEVITHMRRSGIHLPIVGIGGITAVNASEVIRAGADGISVISAISQADDPLAATRQLRQALATNIADTDRLKGAKHD